MAAVSVNPLASRMLCPSSRCLTEELMIVCEEEIRTRFPWILLISPEESAAARRDLSSWVVSAIAFAALVKEWKEN